MLMPATTMTRGVSESRAAPRAPDAAPPAAAALSPLRRLRLTLTTCTASIAASVSASANVVGALLPGQTKRTETQGSRASATPPPALHPEADDPAVAPRSFEVQVRLLIQPGIPCYFTSTCRAHETAKRS